jgi:hypothetical protein
MNGVIPQGATLTNVRVIAGVGTSTVLRNASNLSKKYGGQVSQWQKKGGIIETEYFRHDIHWEELQGVQYRVKLVRRIKK